MEQMNDCQKLLELISGPAFAVKDGTVIYCNREAKACMLEAGTPIHEHLVTGQEEYAELSDDACLCLRVNLCGSTWDASVTRLAGTDVFRLEQPGVPPEVKAMALMGSELRYPVSTLSIVADRLAPAQSAGKYAAIFRQELSRILRILNNASNTERCLTATDPILEEQDICAILRELLEEAGTLLQHAGLTLELQLPSSPVYTLVEERMLRQSVYNLLDNAAKFSPAGGTIRVCAAVSGKRLRLSVSDQGDGISEALRAGVFTRFARQAGIEEGRQNLGLGLALVRATAAIHGGTVLVDTPEDTGTRVTMTLSIRNTTSFTLCAPNPFKIVSSADEGLIMLSNVLPVELYGNNK